MLQKNSGDCKGYLSACQFGYTYWLTDKNIRVLSPQQQGMNGRWSLGVNKIWMKLIKTLPLQPSEWLRFVWPGLIIIAARGREIWSQSVWSKYVVFGRDGSCAEEVETAICQVPERLRRGRVTAIDWASGDQIGKQRLRSLWGKTILFGAGLSSKPTGSFSILVMTNHLSWA